MRYYVRLMQKGDIARVAEIDHESFSNMWPPPNYRQELENRLAHYVVACDIAPKVEQGEEHTSSGRSTVISRSMFGLRRLFNWNSSAVRGALPAPKEYIAGFAGFWMMADEAHLISIAVCEECRRQGIGELLLISVIDLAAELNARMVTLEVRVSNEDAQSLYGKYGFHQVGLRPGYYTDNREDALLMTAENISSAAFQDNLQLLRRAHTSKWGTSIYQECSSGSCMSAE